MQSHKSASPVPSVRDPSQSNARSFCNALAWPSSCRSWGLIDPRSRSVPFALADAASSFSLSAATCASTRSSSTPSSCSETSSSRHLTSTRRRRSCSRMPASGARCVYRSLASPRSSNFSRGRRFERFRVMWPGGDASQ